MEEKEKEYTPSDLKKGHVVKAFLDSPLHPINCGCSGCCTVLKLCCTLVLFNKIQLTMIFGIKVAKVATQLNALL